MIKLLFVIWIATLGADRIDFACGNLEYRITPFILVSPFVAFCYLVKHVINCKVFTLKANNHNNLYWCCALFMQYFLLAFISVLFGNDLLIGSKRLLLLIYQIFFVIIIIELFYNYHIKELLVQGSKLGIALFFIFNVSMLLCFMLPNISEMMSKIQFIDIFLETLGGIVVRFTGASLDPNRGGLILIFYFSNILIFGQQNKINNLFLAIAFILITFTFSRSAIISFAVFVILYVFMTPNVKVRKFIYYILPITLSMALLWSFLIYSLNLNMLFLLKERFSLSPGASGGIHLSVIMKGLEILSESIKVLLVGIGFGNSPTVLSDYYGTKSGNFHSLYLTVLTETGIGGLLTILVLFIMPTFFCNKYIPILVSLLLFNVFYLSILEPTTWMIVVLGWLNLYCFQEWNNLPPLHCLSFSNKSFPSH